MAGIDARYFSMSGSNVASCTCGKVFESVGHIAVALWQGAPCNCFHRNLMQFIDAYAELQNELKIDN